MCPVVFYVVELGSDQALVDLQMLGEGTANVPRFRRILEAGPNRGEARTAPEGVKNLLQQVSVRIAVDRDVLEISDRETGILEAP